MVELLRSLLAYARGAGVDSRWLVIEGDEDFFRVTKRLHNHLHGYEGDGGPLGPEERASYEATIDRNAAEIVPLIDPQDVVLLHDPQTAGLVDAIRATGAIVIWRAHIGLDLPNDLAREAWEFLRPYVADADGYVFSRRAFAWDGLDEEKDHDHPALDRRLLAKERGPLARRGHGDPVRGRPARRSRGRSAVHALGRHSRPGRPGSAPRRGGAAAPGRPGGPAGLALGRAQGPDRRHARVRRARRA